MLKRVHGVVVALVSLLLVWLFSVPIFATELVPTVTFDAKQNQFFYQNTLDKTDLFVNLKHLVPGDAVTQTVQVGAIELKQGQTVKIYLKAENKNADYNVLEGLEEVVLQVEHPSGKDITTALDEPILLHTFAKNDRVNLKVTLEIPTTVGNEIANLEGNVDWIFYAEAFEDSKPVEVEGDKGPKTGDTLPLVLVSILATVSLGLIVVIIVLKRKSNK